MIEPGTRVRVLEDVEVGDFAGKINLKGKEGVVIAHTYPHPVVKFDDMNPHAWFLEKDLEIL